VGTRLFRRRSRRAGNRDFLGCRRGRALDQTISSSAISDSGMAAGNSPKFSIRRGPTAPRANCVLTWLLHEDGRRSERGSCLQSSILDYSQNRASRWEYFPTFRPPTRCSMPRPRSIPPADRPRHLSEKGSKPSRRTRFAAADGRPSRTFFDHRHAEDPPSRNARHFPSDLLKSWKLESPTINGGTKLSDKPVERGGAICGSAPIDGPR